MSKYYLEHYGVPGMKWGKRRTNALGAPVIELGPGSYRESGSSGSKKSNNSTNSGKSSNSSNSGGNNNPKPNSGQNGRSNNKPFDIKATQAGLKDGKKLADAGVKRLEDDRKKQTAKDLKKEAKNMTDDELRTVINRLGMEERYVTAMEKEGFGRSKTDFQKTLEMVGTAVSYADTALSVYDKIQEFRSK